MDEQVETSFVAGDTDLSDAFAPSFSYLRVELEAVELVGEFASVSGGIDYERGFAVGTEAKAFGYEFEEVRLSSSFFGPCEVEAFAVDFRVGFEPTR